MENFLSWNWLVPASMVVMLLELVMVVSKVLLNANPLQVHLQPFISSLRGFPGNPLLTFAESDGSWMEARAHCSRPQHPASPTSGRLGQAPALDQSQSSLPAAAALSANQSAWSSCCCVAAKKTLCQALYFITSRRMASIHLLPRARRILLLPSLVPAGRLPGHLL